jgi:hypothetical protein
VTALTVPFAMFDLSTDKGSLAFLKASARAPGDKIIPVNVNYDQQWLDLMTSKGVDFGFEIATDVPTEGTGAVASAPHTFPGQEVANFDLSGFKNLVEDHQNVTEQHVAAWSHWAHGNDATTLVAPAAGTALIMRAVDPNAPGNAGLVARHRIHIRTISHLIHATMKNYMSTEAYKSFLVDKVKFCYTCELTKRKV